MVLEVCSKDFTLFTVYYLFLHPFTISSPLSKRRPAIILDDKAKAEFKTVAGRATAQIALAAIRFKRLNQRNILTRGKFKPRCIIHFIFISFIANLNICFIL